MTICNIIYDSSVSCLDDVIEKYTSVVGFYDKVEPTNGKPTLYYGRDIVKQLYGPTKPGRYRLGNNLFWSYSVEELEDECWIEKFISESFNSFFRHESIDIDVIFNPHQLKETIDALLNIDEFPIILNGKFVIYLCDTSRQPLRIYSVKKDNLKYAGFDPTELVETIIAALNGRCFMFKTDELELTKYLKTFEDSNLPIFIQDLYKSWTNEDIDTDGIINLFRILDIISKKQLIVYLYYLIKEYSLDIIGYYIDRYINNIVYTTTQYSIVNISSENWCHPDLKKSSVEETILSYLRNIHSAISEQIYSSSPVFMDKSILTTYYTMSSGKINKHVGRILDSIDESGSVFSTYFSRDKTTYRLFSVNSDVNFITESDPVILSSIRPRSTNGVLTSVDYVAFEYSIMSSVLGVTLDEDFHTHTANMLGCSRDKAKNINHSVFYGASINSVYSLLKGLNGADEYLTYIARLFTLRDEFESKLKSEYATKGYVVNSFGHKVYPKKESALFNNVIQSNGSEILNDSTIELFFDLGENSKLLFHRFDEIYFEMDLESFDRDIITITDVMKKPRHNIELSTKIRVGKTLNNLKDL